MKQAITLALLLILSGAMSAQIPYRYASPDVQMVSKEQLWKLKARPAIQQSSVRDIYEMYVDYSAANFDDLFYVWRYSSNYTNADTTVNYNAVVLNNFVGYTDPLDPVGTYLDWSMIGLTDSFPTSVAYTIDSVFFAGTHENNSGNFDGLEMRIVKTNSNGAPSTSNSSILWSQKDSADYGLSASNDWLAELFVLSYAPAYTPAQGQKVAAQLVYTDPTKMDTFSVLSGAVDDGTGAALSPSIYGTSWMKYPPFLTNVIQNVNVIYVDAQGNQIGYFDAQNWIYWYKVTINTAPVGIADNFDNLKVTGLMPNPVNTNAKLLYGVNEASNVSIDLYDISGKFVRNLYNGNDGAGSHIRSIAVNDLSSGTYLIMTKAGEGSPVMTKMIVNH
ncbi:MAG: T9SS type A sorting domain-containing protein [Bacteroidetes bacterium]|nr:T9SS type A sorting domain-containing protein [Bacteroidota bacterium]